MISLSSMRSHVALGAEELGFMFTSRKACVAKLAVLAALALAATGAAAAKKTVQVSTGKVSVPASILSGAAVTVGRAFYAPRLPEDTLAGIRLGRQAKEVLARWGNPSRITVGITQSQAAQPGAALAVPGIPYTPPQTNVFGGGLSSGVNQAAGMLGLQTPPITTPGALPGLPGMNPPGITPPAAAEFAPAVTTGPSTITSEEITWTYDLQNGITLEFIITDGLVTQITVGGQGPWGLSKTRTGLQLGDTYKLVLWVCGYPENQRYTGRFLRASYVNKSRALYTFLDKKLVGVTIAMVPEQLQQ
jgi:hypothetical protein